MGLVLFFSWWYGAGWKNAFTNIQIHAQRVMQEFSLGIVARSLFEPWKQITLYAGPNASLDVRLHVIFDNLFARLFGFVIRSGLIIIGLIATGFVIIFSIVAALLWPVIPMLPLVCIVLAVR